MLPTQADEWRCYGLLNCECLLFLPFCDLLLLNRDAKILFTFFVTFFDLNCLFIRYEKYIILARSCWIFLTFEYEY